MANVRASSRSASGSGSQRLFGKASLVGNTVRAKIGGRVTALAIPSSETAKLERAGQDAVAHRKLRAPPDYALELEHAYGYSEGPQNVVSTGSGSYCYALSSLGVLWDQESQTQRFLQGHTAEVTAIAYSSSTRLIATGQKFVGNKSSGIRIWSLDQPGQVKQRSQILGHTQSVYSLAFSADGCWLFSMAAEDRARSKGRSNDLTATTSPLCAWKLDDAKLKAGLQPRAAHLRLAMKEKVRLVPHPEESNRLLAFGSRAAYFVTCDWAAKDVSQRATWVSPSPPTDANGLAFYGFSAGCFIPGEDNLVVLAVASGVFVIDASESGPVCRFGLPLENLEVRFLLPLPSGHVLCGGAGECSLLESDLKTAEMVKISGIAADLAAAAVLEEGSIVAGATDGSLCRLRLDIETRQGSADVLQQSPSGSSEVRALAVNPSSPKNLAVADSSGVVFFYDLEKHHLLSSQGPFCGAVSAMAWHPVGKFLVLGLEAGNLYGLVLEGGNITELEITHFLSDPSEVTALRFSPEGNWLAVGHRDGQVQVLAVTVTSSSNSPTYKAIQYRLLPGNASAIIGLQFTKDGTSVASNARDGAVLCWEVETGKQAVSNFPAETWFGEGHCFRLTISWAMWGAWSRDSYRSSAAVHGESHGTLRLLATGDEDGLVRLQRFPVPVPDALSKDYHGHASRVADLAWAGPDRLVTAGTGSCALIQWRLISQRRSDGAQPKDSAQRTSPRDTRASSTPGKRGPQSPKTVSASMRSTGSTDAGPASRVSNTSTATAQSKSPAKPAGRPKARVASPQRTQRSPSPRDARGRTPTRSGRSSQGSGSASMDPAKVRMAAKLARPSSRPSGRFKEVSVQTDLVQAPGVYMAAAPGYAGRFIAVDRSVPWQVPSRHASPVRLISPPRLVSAPAVVSRIVEPTVPRLNMDGLVPPSPRVLLSPAAGYRAPTPGAQGQAPRSPSPAGRAFTPPVLRLTEPVSQISSPMPDRRIISIPSTPCGQVRSITPGPCFVTPRAAEPQSDFMVRIVSGNDHSAVIAIADVYLQRPPFQVDRAVAYGTNADGVMQELFSMPRGSGVLRANPTTLLWLSLKQECGVQPSTRRMALQLVIPAGKNLDGGNVPPVAAGNGTWGVASSTARPLAADEGILQMGVGELKLSLESKLDDVLKTWLGFVRNPGTSLSTSTSL